MAYILAFDMEYTGMNPKIHHLVDIGCVLYKISENKMIESYSAIINMPKTSTWDPKTVEDFWMTKVSRDYYFQVKNSVESGLVLMYIFVHADLFKGVNMQCALDGFVKFARRCWDITDGNLVMGSDRLDQDAAWLTYLLIEHGHPALTQIFGQDTRLLDFSSYFQGCSMTLHSNIRSFEKNTKKGFDPAEAAFRYFRIGTRPSVPKSHRAVQDAEHVAQAASMIMNAIQLFITPLIKNMCWNKTP